MSEDRDVRDRLIRLEVKVDEVLIRLDERGRQHERRLDELDVRIARVDERVDQHDVRWARLAGVAAIGGSSSGAAVAGLLRLLFGG